MNKQAEAKALRAQAEELLRKAEECEKEYQKNTSRFKDGYYVVMLDGGIEKGLNIFTPTARMENYGQVFTTPGRAAAFRGFMQAMFNLRNACEPYLTDNKNGYTPAIVDGQSNWLGTYLQPKFLWVKTAQDALRIAQNHRKDIETIQNFKWEI